MSFKESIYIYDIDHENVFDIMRSKYLLLYFPVDKELILWSWYAKLTKPCFSPCLIISMITRFNDYGKVSNIRRTKSQNLNTSRLIF